MRNLRHGVFWPPFLVLAGSVAFSLADAPRFMAAAAWLNTWLLDRFGWMYAVGALVFLALCGWAYLSPLGKTVIGGPGAQPLLGRWHWFSITLCTTVAIGILFWGTAEPLYHLHQPPVGLGLQPGAPETARFALSTLFLHWTFTPYGIYTLAALAFALAYYNQRQPFSLASMLSPLLSGKTRRRFGGAIDSICLYALAAGMSASLGAGLLVLAGGWSTLTGQPADRTVMAWIAVSLVVVFVLSAGSSLLRGIRTLSVWNMAAFVGFAAFVFLFGPSRYIVSLAVESTGDYLQHFFQRSLYTGAAGNDPWPRAWSLFYWANWLAWAPVTALFLGRLGVGYSVREFIRMNLIFPALFSGAWMAIFGGAALYADRSEAGSPLFAALTARGPESVLFSLLERYPLFSLSTAGFLVIAFLSYVTAADSNTSAMSGLSVKGITPDSPEAPVWIKLIWGLVVGAVAWTLVAYAGIDGVKMASTLGGFPALLLMAAVAAGMARRLRNPSRWN